MGKVAVNHLVALDELEVEDGRILIHREEQGVFLWALGADEAADPDPAVWGSYGEPGDAWTVQAPSLSLFLTELLVLDAAFGGLGGSGFGTHSQIRRSEAERVLAPLGELPWPPWSWPPDQARFLAGDGVVAFLTCERAGDEDWCSAYVGGRDAGALAPFRALATSDDWEWWGEA